MKIFRLFLFCSISMQIYAGDMGFSLMYRPPLFGCAKDGCNKYKFSMSPTSKIENASTKDSKVSDGTVLTEQHFIGYWAPKISSLYFIAPLFADHNVYGNSYTALDIDVIATYYHYPYNIVPGRSNLYAPIINWTHSQDSNVGLNGSQDGGFAYYLYENYFHTKHHDRTYPLFSPKTPNLTTISYANLKVPVGTVQEYFSGTSSADHPVLAYWPLHMIDPLESSYPDINDKDGFYYPAIKSKITNYGKMYESIGF